MTSLFRVNSEKNPKNQETFALIQFSLLVTYPIIEHFEILDPVLLVSTCTFKAYKSTCKIDSSTVFHSQPKSTNI